MMSHSRNELSLRERFLFTNTKTMPILPNSDIEFGRQHLDGTETKTRIKKCTYQESLNYKKLGQASAENINIAIFMAIKHCKNFQERVKAYRISDSGISVVLTREHRKINTNAPRYRSIIFYEN